MLLPLQQLFDACYAAIPRKPSPEAVEPLLVGHRGVFGHPRYRENTLAAFDLAVDCGGALEMDLRLSRDGVVVVTHDDNLQRVHGVPVAVSQTEAAGLSQMAPTVPKLQEVLERYGRQCPRYFLELKIYRPETQLERLVAEVGRLLKEADLIEVTTILSLDPRPLDCARRLLPEVERVFVYGASPRRAAAYVKEHGDTGLAGWYFRFPASLRSMLSERGLHQGVGFINHPSTLTAFRNHGFKFHFTDRIDRLVTT